MCYIPKKKESTIKSNILTLKIDATNILKVLRVILLFILINHDNIHTFVYNNLKFTP